MNAGESLPPYLGFMSELFTATYLYVFVPATVLLASYILIAYAVNMARGKGEDLSSENKFRRGVAILFPFLISLYAVLVSETQNISIQVTIPFWVSLIIGILVGFLFIRWISTMKDDEELYATLSCLVASMIFFTIGTVFVITKSFAIISLIFGFLLGTCAYIIRYGFASLDKIKLSVKPSALNFFRRKEAASDMPANEDAPH
uniref:Uncharacterized protein n=1 Tax=Candidatus Kentrum sp. DK TaxID=2126562 RepID=A0A450TBE5_9GAMM|nr:MAG: hypothetical protein BECKDK2373C_GA0170839_111412 [Candidatus Kentron sp. DK]